jgi:hypothetical protein
MSRRCGKGAIHFDEHEPRRIIGLLHDVESGYSRFLGTRARIHHCRGLERLDALWLYTDMNVNDEHSAMVPNRRSDAKP